MKKLLLILIGIIQLVSCSKNNDWENKEKFRQLLCADGKPAEWCDCALNGYMSRYTEKQFLNLSSSEAMNAAESVARECVKYF